MKHILPLLLLLCLPSLAWSQVTFVEVDKSTNSDSDPLTHTIPADWDVGDLVIAHVNTRSLATISSISSGTGTWNLADSDTTAPAARTFLYWKVLEEDDLGATLTVDLPGTPSDATAYIALIRITGADPDTPINAVDMTDDGAGVTAHVAPTVTTTVEDCLILHSFTVPTGAGAISPTSGATGTEQYYDSSSYYLATQTKESAGALGTATYTSVGSRRFTLATIAIQPTAAPVLPPSGLPVVIFPATRPGLIIGPPIAE